MSKAEVTLPAAVSSVPTARHFIESILSGWGMPELAWPATLIVSELAANAALHARGNSFTIRVGVEAVGGVRVEVRDSSSRLPQQRSYSDEATTGRGLKLVASLAHEWGVDTTAEGKSVWALLRAADEAQTDRDDDIDALLEAFDDGEAPRLGGDTRGTPNAVASWHLPVAA